MSKVEACGYQERLSLIKPKQMSGFTGPLNIKLLRVWKIIIKEITPICGCFSLKNGQQAIRLDIDLKSSKYRCHRKNRTCLYGIVKWNIMAMHINTVHL